MSDDYDNYRVCDRCGSPSPRVPVCGACETNERGFQQGEKNAIAKVVMWLRGPHPGSDTVAWQDCVRPILDDLADSIEAGEHVAQTTEYLND